jgi:hypothetical protein
VCVSRPDRIKHLYLIHADTAQNCSITLSFYFSALGSVPLFSTQIVAKQLPAVFILVAVHAQVFPVRAVGGIVPVVPVFVVHS